MFYRRLVVVLLCCALFSGNFAHFSSAEVVQAYRIPTESSSQYSFSNTTVCIPSVAEPSEIFQTSYIPSRHVRALVPRCDNPCRPVGLPEPSIPSTPSTVHNKTYTGIAAEEDGKTVETVEDEAVSNISFIPDSTDPILQMSGERLAPPAEVPREQDIAVLPSDSVVERLPVPDNREHLWDTPNFLVADARSGIVSGCEPFEEWSCSNLKDATNSCTCFTCVVCGDCRQNRNSCKNSCGTSDDEDWCSPLNQTYTRGATVFSVPNMIGNSAWLTGYHVGEGGSAFASPTMLLSRPNVAEHFNAEVQNRIWADYRHWNNAVSFNHESRAVEQYSFGLEKKILKRSSIELRIPLFYQYGSKQNDGSTSVELGNVSVFAKQILRRGPRWTFVGGVGISLPTAENWQPSTGVLKNETYYLVPFLGAQWHPNNSTFGHFVVQADVPIEKNELIVGSEQIKVDGQQVIRTGVQLGRWIYRADNGKRPCRFGVFAEVDYAVVTDRSADWADSSSTMYVNADARKSTLTAAVGMPMVFGKLTCTNALILPVSDGNRPFSAAYNFSLSRQF